MHQINRMRAATPLPRTQFAVTSVTDRLSSWNISGFIGGCRIDVLAYQDKLAQQRMGKAAWRVAGNNRGTQARGQLSRSTASLA
ncbi:hypothetical protein PV318_00160 [Streptomyces sp. ME02-6991-2B]|nr:hypothetical protein [Streptomyces sp. ME02-6991-2B]